MPHARQDGPREDLDRDLDRSFPVPTPIDAVEAALVTALEMATAAGRFDVVAQLAKELEARRLARLGVTRRRRVQTRVYLLRPRRTKRPHHLAGLRDLPCDDPALTDRQ
jgi:hypothetical protein